MEKMTTKTTSVLNHRRSHHKPRFPTSDFKFMFNCTVLLLLCNSYLIHTTSAAVTGPDFSFEQCFQQPQMGAIGTCLGHRALSYLQRFEETPNMTLFDGSLKISRSDKDPDFGTQSRSLVNFLDLDPMDFRFVI